MSPRLRLFLRRRAPLVVGAYVVAKLPLEVPIMANWAWWDFLLLVLASGLIVWGIAPELRKILPINIVVANNEKDKALATLILILALAIVLAEYIDLADRHASALLEFERLREYWANRVSTSLS